MTSIIVKTVGKSHASSDVHVSLWALVQCTRRGTKLWLEAAARAHERRRASEDVGADTVRDTGIDPETASGIHAYQAELRFFMQSGFGKR